MTRCPLVLVLLAFARTLLPAQSFGVEADARIAAVASITTERVKQHVGVLADDTYEGREIGTRGNRAASGYIIDRLKKAGLQPAGPKGSYYQNFSNGHNILAVVEGRDPQLKSQYILVSAHYDHVGYGSSRDSYGPVGFIHNGADDNASGVAALLEVAEAINALPDRPNRSILFAFWDGEEKGLLGSKAWAEQPTVPLNDVKLMINIDMIGRLRKERLEILGVRTATGLRELVSRQNDVGLLLDFNWEIKGDSDHYTFFAREIPVLMLHTGLHDDYHRPSDDAEKINVEGLKQITQLLCYLTLDLAERPTLAPFRRQSRFESKFIQKASEAALSPPPGRLGLRWDEAAAREGRVVVISVQRGSAAERAGIRVGDRLDKLTGVPITNADAFRQRILAVDGPQTLTVIRAGQEAPLDLPLELPGEPVRLGISWRTDEAEPGCVIVNRLVPGSPAEQAGVRIGDRVYKIAGREFANSDEFRTLAKSLPSPLLLEVESGGRVRAVEIKQPDDEKPISSPGLDKLPGPVEPEAAES